MVKSKAKPAPKVETRKITDFTPDPSNANAGTERGLRSLDDSLAELGLGRSIVVDKNGVIIGGNKTAERSIDRGFEDAIVVHSTGDQLVVVQRDDLDLMDDDPNNKARRLAYRDNRVAELDLQWSPEQLLADVNAGFNFNGIFNPDELDELLADLRDEPAGDPGAQVDKAAELQTKWQTERGQLWLIGKHRLLCGDSTYADDVARVMGGEKASIMVTDPPYNVAQDTEIYAQNQSKALKQLAESEWDYGFDPILFLEATKNSLTNDCWQYVFTAHHLFGKIFEWLNNRHAKTSFCVWCKPNPMPSLTKRTWTFAVELCLFGKSGSPTFNYPDGEHCLNWWPINKASDGTHPTQKTLEVICHIISHCSKELDVVNDFFGGSGTTMVACEQLGRQCRMIEIEPKYCAVILERMTGMGLEARLDNGESQHS